MIRNYHILKHLVNEFKQLTGFKVVEIFSQDKDILVFSFNDGELFKYLIFDATTGTSCIYLSKQFNRAKANSIDLFQDAIGEVVQDISLIENERIIDISCIHTHFLFFLFGGSKSNCLVVNNQDIILYSFKKNDELTGTKYELTAQQLNRLQDHMDDITIIQAIIKSNFLLGKELARELCHQEKIQLDNKMSDLDKIELIRLEERINYFINDLAQRREYFLLKNDRNELLVSQILLQDYPETLLKSDSISHCIFQKIKSHKIYFALEEKKRIIRDFLNKELKKQEKKILDIKLAESNLYLEEQYKSWAILLSSQSDLKVKGAKNATLRDFEDNEIIIPLDDKLNLIENAENYFKKSRKTRLNIENRQKFLPEINKKIDKITFYMESLNVCTHLKEIYNLAEEINKSGFKLETDSHKEPGLKYRQFDLGEGFTLYVGKSASNNDELTFKFARQNDLWFHARGSSGSHAVLPLERNQKPSKQILQKAASISAYYSGMKNAKYVPVAYTLRKYIKKPKGANPGAVILMKEEVIMVEPKLPE